MPVAEMLERLSARELDDWRTYAMIEPFGEERADLRMGILASVIANANRAKGASPFEPADFMPDFDKAPEAPITEDGAAKNAKFMADALAASQTGS